MREECSAAVVVDYKVYNFLLVLVKFLKPTLKLIEIHMTIWHHEHVYLEEKMNHPTNPNFFPSISFAIL